MLATFTRDRMAEIGVRSGSELARRMGCNQMVTHRILSSIGGFREATLQKLADALEVDIREVREMAGRPSGERTRFELPPEADRLTTKQRGVVLAMVRAFLDDSGSGK